MVKIMSLVTGAHGVFPFATSVRVTVPVALSVAPGVYVGFVAFTFVYDPSPLVVQTKSAVFASVVAVGLYVVFSQIVVVLGPALIIGLGMMFTLTVLVSEGQFVPEEVVSVKGMPAGNSVLAFKTSSALGV